VNSILFTELAIEFADRGDAAGFHVFDALADGDEFLVAEAERGECLAQEFVVRSKSSAGELPLNLSPDVGSNINRHASPPQGLYHGAAGLGVVSFRTSVVSGSETGNVDNDCRMPERLAEVRRRLSDVSWLMRFIAEPIARRANREDQVTGRFWQGRFKAVKLCDEAAILACSVYVDLNPIRAGLATTPESSDFTSVQRRIETFRQAAGAANKVGESRPDAWLAPIPLREASTPPGPQPSGAGRRASDKGFLPLSVEDYLQLVDWTGRQIVRGRGGRIPAELPPLLSRVGIAERDWLPLVTRFGQLFHRVAGAPLTLARLARRGKPPERRRFRPGHAELLGRR
jgi:hypothetical protein